MRLCVALELRFMRLPEGSVWTRVQPFWERYLDVFEHVRCIARVRDVARLDGEWHRADGRNVSFNAVPHYIGVGEFLRYARRIRRVVNQSVHPGDAFLLRVPGIVGGLAWRRLNSLRYPYAVEVVGDPDRAFAPGAIEHPLRGFFRWQLSRQLRLQCARACAASYVNGQVLPKRYPSSCPSIVASSIELHDGMIAPAPRCFSPGSCPVRLVFVGSLEQYYKAPDVLIRAFAQCLGRGVDLRLTMIGEGRHGVALEELAAGLGCRDRIRFTGQLTAGSHVNAELDRADLFVLPSRSEGLPRAMLEAMARGLPCIGSDAGGIPELLPPDAIVPSGDVCALADKICEVVRDPRRMSDMSAANLVRVRAYRCAVLQQRRVGFYRCLHGATERWLREHGYQQARSSPDPLLIQPREL